MSGRGRYDSAMFWLAFGTASAVIGLALMTIGVTRSPAGANLLASLWFDGGLVVLALGGLLLLWALSLYLRRRGAETPSEGGPRADVGDTMTEAVRGYYREREKLIDMYERKENRRGGKPKS